ncbi:MAG: SAM-dependent methyltransferase, partial [Burkholderiales bacterium]
MHPNALIELATDLLHNILQFAFPADRVISDFFRRHRTLGPRERHSIAETVYAVLRRRTLFQHLAQSGHGEHTRRLVLLGWQGNAGFLRAALSEAEQGWLNQIQAMNLEGLPEKYKHNLPDWLAEALKSSVAESFWPLVHSLQEMAPLDVRVNTLKMKREDALSALMAAQLPAQLTPFSPWGLRFEGKPALNKQALFQS